MTQKYYVERLLPVYVRAIEAAREIDDKPWILQEDNDKSHGHALPKGLDKSLATTYKDEHQIKTLVHPAQSPDLNPIEACWNILKPRVRRRKWDTLDELKAIIQEEWKAITIKEVQERIREMPERCKKVIKAKGGPVKSKLW